MSIEYEFADTIFCLSININDENHSYISFPLTEIDTNYSNEFLCFSFGNESKFYWDYIFEKRIELDTNLIIGFNEFFLDKNLSFEDIKRTITNLD